MYDEEKLDEIAPEYRSENLLGLNDLYHLEMRDRIIPREGGVSALEFGCGAGGWTRVLCERYETVDVVEGSRTLLGQLRVGKYEQKLSRHHSLLEDFSPSVGKRWQHVFMTFLLEHLTDPVAALRKIGGLIETGGSLFLAVPNANSIHRVISTRAGITKSTNQLSENDLRVGHLRVYTIELLRSQVKEAGFSIDKEWSIGLKPLTLGQLENLSPQVGAALAASGDLAPEFSAYIGVQA